LVAFLKTLTDEQYLAQTSAGSAEK
jgi:hypothetical protein